VHDEDECHQTADVALQQLGRLPKLVELARALKFWIKTRGHCDDKIFFSTNAFDVNIVQ
jgi:hypothetical protein